MKKAVAVLALALGMTFGASTFATAQSWNSNAPRIAPRNMPHAYGVHPRQVQKQRQVHRQLQREYRRQQQRAYQRQYYSDRRDRGYYRDGYGRSGYYRSGPGYYYN
ncbi:hypothetical protein ACLBXM_10255 [Xanthobacteraceae bacterium A53D]